MIDYVIQSHSLFELWDFPLIGILTIIGILYILLTGSLHHLIGGVNPVSFKQKSLFLLGLLLTIITIGGPLHIVGHNYLFSVHMLQQAILFMVIVPLLMLGTPSVAFQFIVKKQVLMRMVTFLTHPVFSILFFNGLFSIYHFPLVFDAIMANHSLFSIVHFILLVGAILMWWSLLSPVPEINRLRDLSRIGFIFMSGALITPVCALIIFSSTPMYSAYTDVPQLISFLTPIEDQRLGGIVMKMIQEGVFITSIAVIFFKWARKERSNEPKFVGM
jgi:putative membrane protein